MQSSVARDLLREDTGNWGPPGPPPSRGLWAPALPTQQAALLLLRLPRLPAPSQRSPLGCAAPDKGKVFARKLPLLSVQGEGPQPGRAWIYILGAPPEWERANLMPVTGRLLAPLSRGRSQTCCRRGKKKLEAV